MRLFPRKTRCLASSESRASNRESNEQEDDSADETSADYSSEEDEDLEDDLDAEPTDAELDLIKAFEEMSGRQLNKMNSEVFTTKGKLKRKYKYLEQFANKPAKTANKHHKDNRPFLAFTTINSSKVHVGLVEVRGTADTLWDLPEPVLAHQHMVLKTCSIEPQHGANWSLIREPLSLQC